LILLSYNLDAISDWNQVLTRTKGGNYLNQEGHQKKRVFLTFARSQVLVRAALAIASL
jgi:hypothetical protein